MNILYPFQGLQYNRVLQIVNLDGTPASGVYTIGSVLSAAVWEGQNQAALATPSVSWYGGTSANPQTGYDQGQILLSVAGNQTANLDPAGEYHLLITQTTAAITGPVWDGRFKVLATPGSTSPAPPNLATLDFVEASMSELDLSDSERDFIPYLVPIASSAIRRFCFGRNFDMRTYTEEYDLTLDGTAMLYQKPVQQVLKVQTAPDDALLVSNNSSNVQDAQVVFTYTGEYDGYGPNNQVVTGITLNWSSLGTQNTASVPYVAGMTIGTLAAAINAVGNGWSAYAQGSYAAWSVIQLIGGYTGQEASTMTNSDGVTLQVYGTNLSLPQNALNQRTGLLICGMNGTGNSFDSPRWGPDFGAFTGDWGRQGTGRILVTYTAGFLAIPYPVQLACAELVKNQLIRLKTDEILKSENAADYSYVLRDEMMGSMPPNVRQGLSPYRLHWAG